MPQLDIAINARKAKQGAREFDSAAGKVKRSAGDIDRGIRRNDKSFTTFGGSIKKVAIGLMGLAAAYKGLRFFQSAIKEAVTFEMELANVATMLDDQTMRYLPRYKNQLSKLAVGYGEATSTLSKGLYDILSASIDAADALDVLEVATIAAKAGLTDTGSAADILTTIINAYGMAAEDATRISDILFATVKRGKTTFAELAGSMGMVVSLAATAGLSIEEVSAALATMTRAGIKTERAITGLRAILVAFLSPTEQNKKAAEALGLELNTNTLRTIGLTGAVRQLEGATAEQIAEIFTNVRALTVLAPLLTATEGHMRDLGEVTKSTGKTQEAFAKIADTLGTKLAKQTEAWKAAKRALGEEFSPEVTELSESLTWLLPHLGKTTKFIKDGLTVAMKHSLVELVAYGVEFKILRNISKDLSPAIGRTEKEFRDLHKELDDVTEITSYLTELMNLKKGLVSTLKDVGGLTEGFAEQGDYLIAQMQYYKDLRILLNDLSKVPPFTEAYLKGLEELDKVSKAVLQDIVNFGKTDAEIIISQFEKMGQALSGEELKAYNRELDNLKTKYKELAGLEEVEQRAKETAKYLDDQASAYRRLYDDLNLQNIQNYEYKIALLNKEKEAYERFIDDKILLDQWYAERKRELDRKRDIESENFFTGFRAGVMQIEEETLTWGEIGEQVAKDMNSSFADALMEMTTNGASWKDAMKGFALDIGRSLQRMMAEQIAAQVMMSAMGMIGGAIGGALFPVGGAAGGFGAGGATMFAKKGLVLSRDSVVPFGKGGVLNRPTIFPMSNGAIGLGGEEGKEGLMPLGRDSRGRLGVRTSGDEGGRTPIKIINVMDFSQVQEYLDTADGEMQVVNIMRRNSNEIQEVTG